MIRSNQRFRPCQMADWDPQNSGPAAEAVDTAQKRQRSILIATEVYIIIGLLPHGLLFTTSLVLPTLRKLILLRSAVDSARHVATWWTNYGRIRCAAVCVALAPAHSSD